MKLLKQFFDFYLRSSIHVALMILCIYEITVFEHKVDSTLYERLFIFFSSLSAYNFVKYFSFLKNNPQKITNNFKGILFVSIISLICSAGLFTFFSYAEQVIISIATLFLGLYTIPINSSLMNLRNIGGVKIHIVALCWTLMTLALPIINEVTFQDSSFCLSVIKRYLWIILAILPFEIADFNSDSKTLGTLPQVLGIKKTKIIGYFIVTIILILVYFGAVEVWLCYITMMIFYLYFLSTSSLVQSAFRNLFWVEAIPFIGWLLVYLQQQH
ncbi:MAG: hypothetical protein ACKVJM_00310 [Flavobacteriales bacterium]|nr:hypothetical protein [Flavobacteriaceae bacterium]MDO7582457.1 hypothetical protein [Flavobacteriaceae bacterium]MDO7591156.1 hypothetical protein [Flavobacteriaceae bacterium]MDO7599774.1 hypothetical protein [Flavobacteriaceae bacterium]MDO7602693.1 hypothetical protein [Flavobacteriaceae bacterium]